jgi:hypothetical protein
VRVLGSLFRRLFLTRLLELHEAGGLLIPSEAAHPFRDDVAPLFRNIVAP